MQSRLGGPLSSFAGIHRRRGVERALSFPWKRESSVVTAMPVASRLVSQRLSGSSLGRGASSLVQPLQTFLGEFESAQDGASLVHALVVLARGDGVGDDAGTGLQVGNFIFD